MAAGLGGVLLTLAAWAALQMYGKAQYRAGYAAAQQHADGLRQRLEQGMQYEKEQADARLRGAVLAREAAARDLAVARRRLDGLLSTHGRDPESPAAGTRADGADPDWIGGFAACYAEYGSLAHDAAVWADRVNGLQDWARQVVSPGAH
ncbi:hypothetical protein AAV32_09825 [Kerstersia gyiorum]|uniref:Uncharacterized protein n=1 Tax=Kerstersia gyiorum TaxID=206506 RepID=A0A171KSM3_9BURK|nr:hypothetical protein AAV32_09825 [Kerstersia gyiorum]